MFVFVLRMYRESLSMLILKKNLAFDYQEIGIKKASPG